ncbi:MAG: thioredoxin family protein [bacterium]|nr:MAG: thioredoxin family protein [bacterium]
MKKHIISYWGVGVLLLASCALIPQRCTQKSTHQLPSKPILTGWMTQQQILDQIQAYQLEKDRYQPDHKSLEKIKALTADVQIIIFLGTWCPDSQREVPRFLKIMELAQNPNISYKLFGLDRSKRDLDGLAEKHQVEFVPTFVVLHNDEEIGRIIETPMVSIEQDLVEILAPVM